MINVYTCLMDQFRVAMTGNKPLGVIVLTGDIGVSFNGTG